MPDVHESKRRPQLRVNGITPTAQAIPYAELHCKTNFSFLEGASHADELVHRAVELGYSALAITDRNSLAGVVRAYAALKELQQTAAEVDAELNFKLLIGAEITLEDAPPIVLLATDRAAYGRLCRLLTVGRRRAEKGECELEFADVAEHADGLLGLVCCRMEETCTQEEMIGHLNAYQEVFTDRCYALAELACGPDDEGDLRKLRDLAAQAQVPIVAGGDVHYHVPERAPLHDVLTALRKGETVSDVGEYRFTNAERHLKPVEELVAQFSSVPDAVARTREVASRCSFSLDELRYEYPEELCPTGLSPFEYLRQLTWQGAREHYPQGVPEKVAGLLKHELALIHELNYEAYFLTVWDLVRFARKQNILCQGRGSAANSAVCFCLGVTSVNPDEQSVLFERFISKERGEAPDIDIDFEHERREEVLQYVYRKYGRHRAGMTATVITYRPRSAVRDVGKALGISPDKIDSLAKSVDRHMVDPDSAQTMLGERCREVGLPPDSAVGQRFLYLVPQLLGFPRHLSQHTGGMVMTQGPLCEVVPIENASMADRTVVQWDKDDLDTLGILKVDCLALGMLTAIHKAFDFVEAHYGKPLTLDTVPSDDPQVYEMACRADTIGVFQIESRAQMSMLPRLKPRKFYDLVIEVALVRPGPIQGGMVHPYLRRRAGEEKEEYPNDAVRGVLERTLGVPIFQEQAMQLAIVAAGFTPGEADQLRRAMGAWRRTGDIAQFRAKLIDGMKANGLDREFAERVYKQICGFGEYGFPESHAASFARLAYISAWLKYHYPEVFCAALLNSQPMGFYAPAQLVRDAREHGVKILPCDVNHSAWDHQLEADSTEKRRAIRLGFRIILGFSKSHAPQIEQARNSARYQSFSDFAQRTGLQQACLKRLANASAFESLRLDRRAALWHALAHDGTRLPLFDGLPQPDATPRNLPALDSAEQVFADYATLTLSLKGHPLEFLRTYLDSLDVVTAAELPERDADELVTVAGIVLLRQRPSTAKGITFMTLEDETGIANLVVFQDVWERHRRIALSSTVLLAHGKVQRADEVIHVVLDRMQGIPQDRLQELHSRSRDFH